MTSINEILTLQNSNKFTKFGNSIHYKYISRDLSAHYESRLQSGLYYGLAHRKLAIDFLFVLKLNGTFVSQAF